MDKFDKWLEALLKKRFHGNRGPIISKMVSKFEKKHPEIDPCVLREKLETEADRVYAIVDRSILRDRVLRAKWTFWVTAVLTVTVVGSLGGFTSHSVLPFISPMVNAIVAWLVAVCTISISYNQRVKGGMDSVIFSYEKCLSTGLPDLVQSHRRVTRELRSNPDLCVVNLHGKNPQLALDIIDSDNESFISFDNLDGPDNDIEKAISSSSDTNMGALHLYR